MAMSMLFSADHDEYFVFKGERIAREDAGIIVDFYHFFGRQPISPEEATDWYRNSLAD